MPKIDIPAELGITCSLTQEIMRHPVKTSIGQTYEEEAIKKWLSIHNKDPLTNLPLEDKSLTTDEQKKKEIELFLKEKNCCTDAEFLSALKSENLEAVLELNYLESQINSIHTLPQKRFLLHLAVKKGNIGIVERLLEEGALVNVLDIDRCSPLILAALEGNQAVVELILRAKNNGQPVSIRNEEEQQNLNISESDEEPEYDEEFEEYEPIPSELEEDNHSLFNFKDFSYTENFENSDMVGRSYLFSACEDQLETQVKLLLQIGADPDSSAGNERTPLSVAAQKGNENIVSLLLNAGADPNRKDSEGATPLHWAVQEGNVGVVQLLVNHPKCNPNLEDSRRMGQRTPLLLAVSSSDAKLEIIRSLLEKNADISVTNSHSQTLLYIAVINNKPNIVELLLEKGSDPNEKYKRYEYGEKFHTSLLFVAASKGFGEIVELLLRRGAESNDRGEEGYTLLHLLVSRKLLSSLRLLLSRQNNIDDNKNVDKLTPLHIAVLKKEVEMVRMLIEKGAQIDVKDADGNTPLDLAKKKNISSEIIDLLENPKRISQTHSPAFFDLPNLSHEQQNKRTKLSPE